MTERAQNAIKRTEHTFTIGPSHLHWENDALTIEIKERVPLLGQKVQGTIKVYPDQLFNHVVALDEQGKHRWGPISPSARVEVSFAKPNLHWKGFMMSAKAMAPSASLPLNLISMGQWSPLQRQRESLCERLAGASKEICAQKNLSQLNS